MIRHTLVSFLCLVFAFISQAQSCGDQNNNSPISDNSTIMMGTEATAEYFPLLKGKRVAVMTNQTGMVGS